MRRLTPLLVLALAACADSPIAPGDAPNLARIHEAEDSHGGTPYMAVLLPTTELPIPTGGDPNPDAIGLAVLTLNSGQEEVCFEVSWSDLSSPVFDSHIHEAPAGSSGPIRIRFAQPEYPRFPAATEGSVARCVFASREMIKAIRDNPENFYVNVHTRSVPAASTDRPAGAIRGQLSKTQGSNVNN